MNQPKNLSKNSGLYLFKNVFGEIIYIGKAKDIAKRVASYFTQKDNYKAELILVEASSIETITTQSETEALYLEAQLIKQYQPKFNVLLKDGNPFTFLCFSKEATPKLILTRTKEKKGTYFGPFLTKKQATGVYNFLLSTFQLKLCKQKIEQGCLEYHIGLCTGICKQNFDQDLYLFKLNLARQLLSKDSKTALKDLRKKITELAADLQFEQAQKLTNYKTDLEHITNIIEKLLSMPSKQKEINKEKKLQLLIDIRKRLKLKHIPYVIDCFDISHMQGTFIVGACIRYVHGKPEKKSFRRFKIKTLTDQNDYAALQEIVQRRYKAKDNYPNLIIVDGGVGQINAIKPFIGTAELVGLAKREETIITSNLSNFIKLDPQKAADALLLQVRDYTHHFAISYHRTKRSLLKPDN